MPLTLSLTQMLEALEFAAVDELSDEEKEDTELTFFLKEDDFISDDNEPMSKGIYCYMTEYPEEGIYGPLGKPN